jgi:shikimate dehydrogenase
MALDLNKDTTLCISLAAKPSNFGTRFHNYLYHLLDLNYAYKAFTTTDIAAAVKGIRALGIRGCGVSMPFKEACIPFVDELDESAKAIDSVNTIVNTDGYLKAYNTDYIAIYELIKNNQIDPSTLFALQGSGGMAKAVACALRDLGFKQGYIVARNQQKGMQLAQLCGFEWVAELGDKPAKLLINATPQGMAGVDTQDQLSFSEAQVDAADVIFEVVAMPAQTPLVKLAQQKNKQVILGSDVFAIQAVEQFIMYTGVRPSDEQFRQAAEYSRQG